MWFQKISVPTPRRVNGNSEGEGVEVSKAKPFKEKYQARLKFPGGRELEGSNKNTLHGGWGAVWVFSVTTQSHLF